MTFEYQTTENDENKSIKSILQKQFQISNRLLAKLKMQQKIQIDGKVAWVNETVKSGSIIQVFLDFEEEDEILPQDGKLEILYEDDSFLAVNKPAAMVVHPCSYHPDGTLANYVKAYLKNKKKIRPINRLDNGTSGIVLFAKNEYIQERFKTIEPPPQKEYLAIVYGTFEKKKGTISLPIARKPESLIEREVNFEKGQEAITHYEVLQEGEYRGEKISALKVLLETGRTHQIRVHMTYLGHPLVGDTLYFDARFLQKDTSKLSELNIERQALHASQLRFFHPITQKEIQIFAPLPQDLQKCFPFLGE